MVGRERQLSLLRDAFDSVVGERAVTCSRCSGRRASASRGSSPSSCAPRRRDGPGRPLPLVRRGDHVLAGRRDRQAGRRAGAASATRRRGQRSARSSTTRARRRRRRRSRGVRRLLEATGRRQYPVVCLVDDIQWGEDTFLELVEHVADLSRGADPAPLHGAARAARPAADWAGGKLNATSVLLEPLSEPETDELIGLLLGGSSTRRGRLPGADPARSRRQPALRRGDARARRRVRRRRRGRGAADDPGASRRAARPARRRERAVLEHASIEGEVFHRGGVAGARPGGDRSSTRVSRPRRQGPAAAGTRPARRRGRLPLPPPADSATPPTRRSRRRPAPSCTSASLRGSRSAAPTSSSSTRSSATTSSRRSGTGTSSARPPTTIVAHPPPRPAELLARAGRRAFDRGDRQAAANLLERAGNLLDAPDELRVRR